jgi:hypothetical protein
MAAMTSDDQRLELRGFVGPGDPLWSRCKDMPPRKALTMVLKLAHEAMDIEERLKKFTEEDHPLGKRLRAMTPAEALLYLILWTNDRAELPRTETAALPPRNLTASTPRPQITVPVVDKPRALAAMQFDPDEMEAMGTMPEPQPN